MRHFPVNRVLQPWPGA